MIPEGADGSARISGGGAALALLALSWFWGKRIEKCAAELAVLVQERDLENDIRLAMPEKMCEIFSPETIRLPGNVHIRHPRLSSSPRRKRRRGTGCPGERRTLRAPRTHPPTYQMLEPAALAFEQKLLGERVPSPFGFVPTRLLRGGGRHVFHVEHTHRLLPWCSHTDVRARDALHSATLNAVPIRRVEKFQTRPGDSRFPS